MTQNKISPDDLVWICRKLVGEVAALKAIIAAQGPVSDATMARANTTVGRLMAQGQDKRIDALRAYQQPVLDLLGYDQVREIAQLSGRDDLDGSAKA